ncbi:protein kinase, partial [bacterium]|nr:protein kinase [bacterium]
MRVQPGQTLSHYRLIEKIGEGGMGVVWSAEDTVLQRIVAIKVLPPEVALEEERRRLFLQEARLAASVSHSHIVQVHELARQGDLDFIVMEYIEGSSLRKMLHGRPLPPDRIAELGMQVAEALAKAHDKGLIHRDLKPGNILVTPDGEAKLVDFGLAALVAEGSSTADSLLSTLTLERESGRSTSIRGTLPYMSPEQLRGEALDSRTDVFSLGAVLYEMCAGQRPFMGSSSTDLVREILRCKPIPVHELVPKIPIELQRITEKALERRPSDRYQHMEDVAIDLKRLSKQLDSGVSPSYSDLHRIAPRRPSWLGRPYWLALPILLATAWLLFRDRPSIPPHGEASTVLVLPMEVLEAGENSEHLGRAFSEAIAINLTQDTSVGVLPVGETPQHGGGLTARARALEEHAAWVVTGSLERTQDSLRVVVNLIDVAHNRLRWGARRTVVAPDVAGVAASLARELQRQLGEEPAKLYDFVLYLGTPEMAADPLWGEALGGLMREDRDVHLAATKRLVAAFPDSPEALALRACSLFYTSSEPGKMQELDEVMETLERLDPNEPTPECIRIELLRQAGRYEEVLERASRLIDRRDLTPAARAWPLRNRAGAMQALGRLDAAIEDAETAIRLDPANYYNALVLSFIHQNAGNPEKALLFARQALALNPAPAPYARVADLLGRADRDRESLPYWDKSCQLQPSMVACAGYAIALFRSGEQGEAERVATEAVAQEETLNGMYRLARYNALASHAEEAVDLLERAVQRGVPAEAVAGDDSFVSLRGNPAFDA